MFMKCLLVLFCSCFVLINAQEKRFRDYLQEAIYYKERNEYIKSANAYKHLLVFDPRNYDYLTNISKMYKEAKEYNLATYYYERLLKTYPQDTPAKFELGQIYYWERNHTKAIPLLEDVVSKEPENFQAIMMLARIFVRENNEEKARYYIGLAEKIDRGDEGLWNVVSSFHLQNHRYREAYKYLFETNKISSSQNLLEKIWGLRPFVNPTFHATSAFSRERERDLTTKLMTTEIEVWNHQISLEIPFKDYYKIINKFIFGPEQQKNLIQQRNNYHVGVYNYVVGFEAYKNPHVLVRALSGQKWGKDLPPSIFPFRHEVLWEPSFTTRVAYPNHMLSISAFKDSYLGRNFSNIGKSLFVKRKLAELVYEFRDSKSYSALGALGNIGSYKAVKDNFRKLFALYARYDMNHAPFHMVFDYQYQFSTFRKVDPDYSSHRAEYRHHGKLSLIRSWAAEGYLDFSYKFVWDKRREFVDDSTVILGSDSVPIELELNIYTAHIIEAIGAKTIGNNLDFEMRFFYYMDSNDYRTAAGRLGLKWIF